MAVSLRDISVETGINICSVSQVMNGHPRAQSLRPETRAKILVAAKALGYCRNELAASVARRRGNVLGFVSGEMGGVEYTGRIQNGVLDAASERGYTVSVYHLGGSSHETIIRQLIGWRVAGVIFHVPSLALIGKMTKCLDDQGIVWGTVNLSNPGGIGVTSDDASGVESAVRLLHGYGHRNIVFLGNKNFVSHGLAEYQLRREFGFRQGMAKYYPDRVPALYHMKDTQSFQDACYMRELGETFICNDVDGVICESDVFASALSRAVFAAGYTLPDAFSLVGFSNSIYAEASYPMLTTIAQDFEKMGRDTVHLVADASEKKNLTENRNLLHPVAIIERQSVRNHIVK